MISDIVHYNQLSNSRVDVHIDNKVLKSALDDDGCRNSAINEVIKEIYRCSQDQNFSIQTFYVPSSHNPADKPSRKCSDLDCMLSVGAWLSLERLFGPHSFDLCPWTVTVKKMPTATLCLTTRPGPTPDPLGSTFSLIPYRLDTKFTCFHLLFFLDLFFATLSTKSFNALLRSSFRIFDQDHSGGRPSRPSQSIDFFWARRVPVQSYFSLPSVLKKGSPVLPVGPLGLPMCLLVNIFALQCP